MKRKMIVSTLGIEIRKLGCVRDLYREVDRILSRPTSDKLSLSVSTVAHALQKMFRPDTHFSVCAIRDCAEVCGICIPGDRMSIYSAIHCMKWSEMTPEYREVIVAMVLDDFRPVLTSELESGEGSDEKA